MPEPNELIKARALLSQFEAQMDRPEGLTPLSDALSLLASIRDDATSEHLVQLASNIVLAYAAKLQAVFETLGKRNPSIHNETLNHWIKVYQEFESSGFAMPPRLDYVFVRCCWTKRHSENSAAFRRRSVPIFSRNFSGKRRQTTLTHRNS